MRVKDVMSSDPIIVHKDQTCREAVARMCQRRVRHLPVVDTEGSLEGIITDRDLRHHLLAPDKAGQLGQVPVSTLLEQTRIRDVMSRPVHVTSPNTDLVDAVTMMREHRVGAMPVVEGRRVLGIVTETDLLRQIIAADALAEDVATIVVSFP